jgi:oxygen-dependent protoporphyrinogen oxidase
MQLDDDAVLAAALGETSEHLGVTLQPTDVRISRWAGAFPQYRPLHHERVGAAEASLPATLTLAGASHHGIGIPACIRSAQRAAGATLTALFDTEE